MLDLVVNAAVSILTGFALWVVLPRGVVLTRRPLAEHPLSNEPVYDTWQIQNDSPLPVLILSVDYQGADTMHEDKLCWRRLSEDVDDRRGISLRIDDEVSEIKRLDRQHSWRGVVITPGDTLTATVPNLTDLRIKYRRAGAFGLAERREVWIRGGA
ncbi:hypothetical protein ACFV9G_17955 [Nocardioides sp. NPDC059952]|uniref:hypothetical protein n=1 Tax=Nocardioides sp. NPDC059952 TaxID=3347014 RepID=UPI00365503AE